ncbi:MAG: PASTA domain-containing protein [Acidobacteriota bacterium]
MTIASKGISAVGKLAFVAVLLAAFAFGMVGVVYMSLSGKELTVPEIVGKDFVESEKELAALGLKIKRRADRPSTEKINTVLEQLPKAGETVKTGQMILVVVSKAGIEGEEVPSSLKKGIESDDTEKIEEMITDKPKKPKANSNTSKKKVDTTRDVSANASDSNKSGDIDTASPDGKPDTADTDKNNKVVSPASGPKPVKSPVSDKPAAARPTTAKPSGGDTRPKAPVKP